MAKKFLIIGLGHFGFYLAKLLYEKGEEVIVIDNDEKSIKKIAPFCSKSIKGDIKEKEVLEKLNPADMDKVVVCIGENIEASLLAVQYLQELGVKKERIYAKATSKEHKDMLEKIGVNKVIFPEEEVAKKYAFILRGENVQQFFSIENGYEMVEIPAPSSFVGKTLQELDIINKYGIVIVAVKNPITKKVACPPDKTYKIKDDESLIIAGKEESIEKLLREVK
jgi:trk system potassium uptake protein TrkA